MKLFHSYHKKLSPLCFPAEGTTFVFLVAAFPSVIHSFDRCFGSEVWPCTQISLTVIVRSKYVAGFFWYSLRYWCIMSARTGLWSTVNNQASKCADSFLTSKSWCKILSIRLHDVPQDLAISLTVNRRSSTEFDTLNRPFCNLSDFHFFGISSSAN